jgi:hypothetical protein
LAPRSRHCACEASGRATVSASKVERKNLFMVRRKVG